MSMTFEPFTPARVPEQGGPGGRRRAEEPGVPVLTFAPTEPRRTDRVQTAPIHQETNGTDQQWTGDPTQQWGGGGHPWSPGAEQQPWAGGAGQQWIGGVGQQWTAGAEQQPWAGRVGQQWVSDPQEQTVSAGVVHQWADGAAQHREPPARRTGEQPRWNDELASSFPAVPETTTARDPRGGRFRPVVIGLVSLLMVLAGWQAYRIEGMSGHNAVLAADLAAEKDRTDQMEKQLAVVFDPETISSAVMPSVFRVRAGDFTGTAFSVGNVSASGSNLFTNYHVVAEVWSDGGRTVSLESGSTRISATIQKISKSKDLALLHTTQKIAGLATSGTEVKPGQPVVVVGAPLGLDDSVTTGGISAYRPNDPDGPTIQFDAPINPGNSGGPVVNASEQVVGLATAKVKDAEGIGLAIPIKTACTTFPVC